ncbi:hypothetical protein AVMA1855_25065 [Acidovorax sp. SUPP1855]|uniref:hypothetical protein n=1 Tax=Acidovorax sp. SUPP1855 TaxID=431774 RepID=UPI0023DE5462|nr:hypothetical protein [Acidovorax sp. SUPP1855]GKS87487.1 hypothetical protein AVMA1855_25065 [Acidovorax sp. SUPP1855]
MSSSSKSVRFGQFIEQLNSAPAACSREAAFNLMKEVMDLVEDANGLPANDYVTRMHVYSMTEFFGWSNLQNDPCSWVDSVVASHRTEIYNNGRIVITRIKSPTCVVLDKAGE